MNLSTSFDWKLFTSLAFHREMTAEVIVIVIIIIKVNLILRFFNFAACITLPYFTFGVDVTRRQNIQR